MPKTKKRYPCIVSSAVSEELFDEISNDCKHQQESISNIIRKILEDFYLPEDETYSVSVPKKDVEKLIKMGYEVNNQE